VKLRVLKGIYEHPATRGNRVAAIYRALHWELRKRQSGETRVVDLVGGLRVLCDPQFRGSHVAITYRGLYDYHDMMFLRRYLNEGDVVADVGANIGLFTLMVSRLVGHSGRVDSYEAVPASAERLRQNIALNGVTNVIVHEIAIGNEEGVASFIVGADDLTNRLGDGSSESAHRISVLCRRLDNLTERQYSAIQLDVEGAEPLVLSGAERMLAKGNPPVIILELNGRLRDFGWTEQRLLTWLADHNYVPSLYDGESDALKVLDHSRWDLLANAMDGRDNILAIFRDAMEEVSQRLRRKRYTAGRINTASLAWP
jgi:FkbM family methyltransferase